MAATSMANLTMALYHAPPVSFTFLRSREAQRFSGVLGLSNNCRWTKTAILQVSFSNSVKGCMKCRCSSELYEHSHCLKSSPSNASAEMIAIHANPIASRKVSDNSSSKELVEDNSNQHPIRLSQETIDQPRRTLLVTFTCNLCDTRTQRLVNPDAYRRGTVFVQCAGCEVYHKLVDNLNLVVEYNFRTEAVDNFRSNIDSDAMDTSK